MPRVWTGWPKPGAGAVSAITATCSWAANGRSGGNAATTEPGQAEKILADGSADVILLGRALLREPNWPQRAATELGDDVAWPPQYRSGRPAAVSTP